MNMGLMIRLQIRVKGLSVYKPIIEAKVRVVGLGSGTTIRDHTLDFNLEIAMKDIRPADVELLSRELNLRETTPQH